MGEQKSVLVVDDTATTRILLVRLLEKEDYKVESVDSGPAALESLRNHQPDLVLLDYLMEGMDGPDVIKVMKETQSLADIPVILVTASDHPDHIEKGFGSGAVDYITRPVDKRILLARVKSAISSHEARARAESAAADSAAHNRLVAELEDAQKMQLAQLPGMPMRWEGWRVNASLIASGAVGGDLFNVVTRPDGTRYSMLIDVSGHGAAAALLASNVRGELAAFLLHHSLEDAIARLNESLCELGTDKYTCLAVVEMGSAETRVLNAGLPPAVVLRDGEIVAKVSSSGVPPGLLPAQDYDAEIISIRPGDRIVLMSDGVTEPFGHADDVDDALARLGLSDAENVAETRDSSVLNERIASVFVGHPEGQPDDATVVVISALAHEEVLDVFPRLDDLNGAISWACEKSPTWVDKTALEIGLTEALTNAIVHGVLGVSSDSRRSSPDEYLKQIRERASEATGQGQSVTLAVKPMQDAVAITLKWPGLACPEEYRFVPEPEPDPLAESGRGIMMIYSTFDHVDWLNEGRGMRLTMLAS